MNIIIHRGTHQIGGCVTEISTSQTRILIDFGKELPDINHLVTIDSFALEGVTYGHARCDAVFFTHYHGDHTGMFSCVDPQIPMFMGEVAKDIFLALQQHLQSPYVNRISRINTFFPNKAVRIKDITITPFLVDHSAYDAYMFLIEAEGKKILHTGDFRKHGFRGKGLLPTLSKYVGKVDILIVEGTMLSRKDEDVITETELLGKAKDYLKNSKYVFALCSSTNIDRIAAFYAATPYGKFFICDEYQKDILCIATKYGESHSSLYKFEKVKTYGDNLIPHLLERGFCMLVRNNEYFYKIMRRFDPKESLVLYSLWKGYMQDESYGFNKFLDGFHWEYLHTSGHASKGTIETVSNVVTPQIGIIPIHSEAPTQLNTMNLPYKVIELTDGEQLSL